jgi:hypothetical protein
MPRCVVIDSSFDWGNDAPPRTPLHESIIYELHVKESVAEFRRRVPSVHSAGFFNEKQELGARYPRTGPAVEGCLPPRSLANSDQHRQKAAPFYLHPAPAASICQAPDAFWNNAKLSLGLCQSRSQEEIHHLQSL